MIRIFTAALIMAAFSKPAYAYIDVAIGSLILQSIVAGFFTFMVMWRSWIAKTKNLFHGKGFKLDADSNEATTEK